jgi:hypothetical protein
VTVEKAFAINASPYAIYRALVNELAEADAAGGDFTVLRRDPGRAIGVRTRVGFVPCDVSYELLPRDGYTEVVARLVPLGWRAALFRIATLGLREQNYAVVLVQGLANLKAAVESTAARDDVAESGEPVPPA